MMVAQHRAPGEQHRALEHHADIVRRLVTLTPSMRISPAVGGISPPSSFKSVDFPQPDGPTTGDELACRDVEVERLQRGHVAVARAIGFR
jgi:hypothetical protein